MNLISTLKHNKKNKLAKARKMLWVSWSHTWYFSPLVHHRIFKACKQILPKSMTKQRFPQYPVFRHASVSWTYPRAYNRPDPHITALIQNTTALIQNITALICWISILSASPRDLWPLRHLIRVMSRHDLTKKKTMTKTKTKTKTMTKTNTFREHLQWVILETCDLWDIWSEWWGDMTWPKKDNDKDKYKDKYKDKDKDI